MTKNFKYLILVFLFVFSIGKINAEPLAAGSYKIGDEITYNGMKFYVIANSDEKQDYVTMLKAEPLTVDEVNKYGVGHINKYTVDSVGTAYDKNGYGGMAYYSSSTCGNIGSFVSTGCTNDYSKSEVKYAVDAWAKDKFKISDLKIDSTGYNARLITHKELVTNLGYLNTDYTSNPSTNGLTPGWVYNANYRYWTMSSYQESTSNIWTIYSSGALYYEFTVDTNKVVRPVITLNKIVGFDDSKIENNEIVKPNDKNSESSNMIQKVDVPNTLKNRVIGFSIIGCTLLILGLIIVFILFKTKLTYKRGDKRGRNDDKKSN